MPRKDLRRKGLRYICYMGGSTCRLCYLCCLKILKFVYSDFHDFLLHTTHMEIMEIMETQSESRCLASFSIFSSSVLIQELGFFLCRMSCRPRWMQKGGQCSLLITNVLPAKRTGLARNGISLDKIVDHQPCYPMNLMNLAATSFLTISSISFISHLNWSSQSSRSFAASQLDHLVVLHHLHAPLCG